MEWQFEFPPEVQAEREPILAALDRAMEERTVEAVTQAQTLAGKWLYRHPEDYAIWDAGEPIAMLADALAFMAEQGIAPLERVDYAKEMERWEAEWAQRERTGRVPANVG
jgi:hypothetical protein